MISWAELKSRYEWTPNPEGPAPVKKNFAEFRLADQKDIQVAFIFGSIAEGSEKADSDIDLLVVGEIGLRSLSRFLQGLTGELGREINPYVLAPEEFSLRISENEHFLSQVLMSPKLFIIGDKDDLETMV